LIPGSRGFIVVFNPNAGQRTRYETLRRVTSLFTGRIAPVVETSLDPGFPASLRERIREVRVQTGRDPILVAVGGDGTASMTVAAMRDCADASLALVPCGSGNDFAAGLGIDGVAHALDAIEAGIERRIDVGLVGDRRFLNCVGMGLDAEVGVRAEALRRSGFPPTLSYYAAALICLPTVRPAGVVIRCGAEERRLGDGVMVTVGNGPLYGGGFRGAPHASFDDGALDVHAFGDVRGLLARFTLMRRIRDGAHPAEPNVAWHRCATATVEFDRQVHMHVDGDLTIARRAAFSVLPRALSVIVPATASSAPTAL
jgi:diacylglycerol kinase (ATP)